MLETGVNPPLFKLPNTNGQPFDLADVLGRQRIFLMFEPDEKLLFRVKGQLAQATERDLTVLAVVPTHEQRAQVVSEANLHVLPDSGQVMGLYQAEPGNCFLIGKDGTVKSAWDAAPPLPEVFDQIDAMPMRQAEMSNER